MTELGQASAIVLACVFAVAAVAKVRHQGSMMSSFEGLGLPAPSAMAKVVPFVEAMLAVGLIAAPAKAAVPALVLLVAFTVVIVRAMAAGATVPCACFGGGLHRNSDDRPVSSIEVVRNAGLGALAIVATGAGEGSALGLGRVAAQAVASVAGG